jgi:NAD(P)-dependent dehydrogenase (short-subunit alcohol dehydrogenase family)
MKEFEGKVAVVTGAASGIGRGMVGRFARAGMKVALADVEPEPLAIAELELRGAGADVLAVRTDVSSLESMKALRDKVLARWGKVHILCNNAGVSGGGGPLWETTENDWDWVLGVNLMGVVHGIQAFVPSMLEHGEEGHIVNTSSVLGLSSGPGSIYGVSKHGVTRLSEGLYYDLQAANAKLGVSVLCPGMIATRIIEAERNRPSQLQNPERPRELSAAVAAQRQMMSARFQADGMPPDEVGDIVFEGIREGRFYLLTHPAIKERVRSRMEDILEDRSPGPAGPADGLMGRGPGRAQ